MNTIYSRISPIILAVVTTTGIRLVSDISTSSPFWNRPVTVNLKDFIISVIGCYIFDICIRHSVKKESLQLNDNKNIIRKYIIIAILLLIGTTISCFIAHYFIDYPNYLVDFVVAYVVVIPTGLFYYAMIRNSVAQQNYNRQTLQLEQIKNKQLETELNLLKAQFHPHFLFNALNAVYFQIDDENKTAKQTIELLSNLLRYQLYDISQKVTFKQEREYLESYIKLQKIRSSDRLILNTNFDRQLDEKKIHPLLFQPLLENAFKYTDGEYRINVNCKYENNKIIFVTENSISDNVFHNKKSKGIGIENLRRRLELLYPEKHTLKIEEREKTFFVELTVQTE